MDDLFLIKQTCAGNPGAFKFLVIRYQRPIFKFLSTFGLSAPLIEELAQETFLKAYKNLSSYDPAKGAAFSSWLFVIAKNLALNERARFSHRLEVHEEAEGLEPAAQEASLERVQTREVLGRAIQQLPQEFRNAVVLSYFEELSLEEVAKIEACSVGTIKSRVFRGKQILRKLLQKEGGSK